MFIDLKDLISKENNEVHVDVEIAMDFFDPGSGPCRLVKKSPLSMDLRHESEGKVIVAGEASLTFAIPCDRCLTEVDVPFAVSISKSFDLKRERFGSEEGEAEEARFVTDTMELDAGELLRDELIVAWPAKVLCKEDCRGLCLVCGHDLNAGDCGCDRVVLDPRMAAIQDIFKNAGN